MFNDQLINELAIQIDFREFTVLFGAQLIDMDDAFHSFNGQLNLPTATINRESCFSTEDLW
jgi:hypothetical protein